MPKGPGMLLRKNCSSSEAQSCTGGTCGSLWEGLVHRNGWSLNSGLSYL